MSLESNVAAAPSRSPGFVPGFSFFQSVTSFKSSTLAETPVPTTSVLVNVAPGSLKSESVVHEREAAEATGGSRTTK